MIITFFLYVFGLIVGSVLYVLAKLSLMLHAIPYVQEIFEWLFASLLPFGGIVDIVDIYLAISVLVVFAQVLYTMKLLFWIVQPIPFLNRLTHPFGYRVDVNMREPEYTEYQSQSYRSEGVRYQTAITERHKIKPR